MNEGRALRQTSLLNFITPPPKGPKAKDTKREGGMGDAARSGKHGRDDESNAVILRPLMAENGNCTDDGIVAPEKVEEGTSDAHLLLAGPHPKTTIDASESPAGVEADVQVGCQIEVYWPADDKWYPGTVTRYKGRTKKHDIIYDDGTIEVLDLKAERLRVLSKQATKRKREAVVQMDSKETSLPLYLTSNSAAAEKVTNRQGSTGDTARSGKDARCAGMDVSLNGVSALPSTAANGTDYETVAGEKAEETSTAHLLDDSHPKFFAETADVVQCARAPVKKARFGDRLADITRIVDEKIEKSTKPGDQDEDAQCVGMDVDLNGVNAPPLIAANGNGTLQEIVAGDKAEGPSNAHVLADSHPRTTAIDASEATISEALAQAEPEVQMEPEVEAQVKTKMQVGWRIAVYWPHDDEWYPGTITRHIRKYGERQEQHEITYDDGAIEVLDLKAEMLRVLSKQASNPDQEKKEKKKKTKKKKEEEPAEAETLRTYEEEQRRIEHRNKQKRYGVSLYDVEGVAKEGVAKEVVDEEGVAKAYTATTAKSAKMAKNKTKTKTIGGAQLLKALEESLHIFNESVGAAKRERDFSSPFAHFREVPLAKVPGRDLIGRPFRTYWDGDDAWYGGIIQGYRDGEDGETGSSGEHQIIYDDGTNASESLATERARVRMLPGETLGSDDASADDAAVMMPGMPLVARVKGFPPWPALSLTSLDAKALGLEAYPPQHCPVFFFGTYELGELAKRDVDTIQMGLENGCLQKGLAKKSSSYNKAIHELLAYLTDGVLPDTMAQFDEADTFTEYFEGGEGLGVVGELTDVKFPLTLEELKVEALGEIQFIRPEFHSAKFIFPVGYKVSRMANSRLSKWKDAMHTFSILENEEGPVFVVSITKGKKEEHFSSLIKLFAECFTKGETGNNKRGNLPAVRLFGLNHRAIVKLIQQLPNAERCAKYNSWIGERPEAPPPDETMILAAKAAKAAKLRLPDGVQPLHYAWPTDRCSVCNVAEEYDENLLIQCDKCRLTVHQECYGVEKAPDGVWLCNICSMGLKAPPPCCLCPVVGGPLKETTDGRYAHLSCVVWIPESAPQDVAKMEPIIVKKITPARQKLKCQVCKIQYGVCIQCSDKKCYSAFHPLCARMQNYKTEFNECTTDNTLTRSCFCKKHSFPGGKKKKKNTGDGVSEDREGDILKLAKIDLELANPWASNGCARATAVDMDRRRRRTEPQMLAAALAKRAYLQNMPYVVTGRRNTPALDPYIGGEITPAAADEKMRKFLTEQKKGHPKKAKSAAQDVGKGSARSKPALFVQSEEGLLSLAEKFDKMHKTYGHRLTAGKSAIHGWGLFAKVEHKAGDMMIEYCGDLVRPAIAELREERTYDKLVGAGTYIFRVDEKHCVDATLSGNTAHLINHSCAPNCHSRTLTIAGKNHVVIFSLRDIKVGEELSYDYRFSSERERLPCNCGTTQCRGFVNVDTSDDPQGNLMVRRSELETFRFF